MKRWIAIVVFAATPLPSLAQEPAGATDAVADPAAVPVADPAAVPAADPVVPSAAAVAASSEPIALGVETTVPAVERLAAAEPVVIDRLDLGTTSITGNQELPKVLYIVPWKRSDLGDVIGRPVNSLLDEVLAPVDRSVFERHLSYYETLHGESQEE